MEKENCSGAIKNADVESHSKNFTRHLVRAWPLNSDRRH